MSKNLSFDELVDRIVANNDKTVEDMMLNMHGVERSGYTIKRYGTTVVDNEVEDKLAVIPFGMDVSGVAFDDLDQQIPAFTMKTKINIIKSEDAETPAS